MQAPYDIFKKDAATPLWVEAVDDLEAAKARIAHLAALSGREHFVLDQRTCEIVAVAKAGGCSASFGKSA